LEKVINISYLKFLLIKASR